MSTKKYNRFEFAHKEQPKHGEMKIKKKQNTNHCAETAIRLFVS